MEGTTKETRPFISTDGLAGDATLFRGSIKTRDDTISSLEAKLSDFDHACSKEIEKRALDTNRRSSKRVIKQHLMVSLERKLSAVKENKNQDECDLQVTHEARKASLHEQVAKLHELNQKEKQLIAPIRKLPAELLGYVFRYYVELDHSPWLLMMVSRSWQQTAITTPVLWTYLRFGTELRPEYSRSDDNHWTVDGEVRWSIGRRIICYDVAELQLISNRAGSLCLDIQIGSGTYEAKIPMLRAAIQDASMASRIAGLSISLYGNPAIPGGGDGEMELAPLPNLQSLKLLQVSEAFGVHLLDHVSSSSPHITDFQLSHRLSLSPNYRFWSTLELLDLGGGRYRSPDDALTPSALDVLIPKLKRLKRLENAPYNWPNDRTPPETTLPNLTHLTARCHGRHLEKLNLPSLTHLSIKERHFEYSSVPTGPSAICFPALIMLELESCYPADWLHILSAPMMSTIVLSGLSYGAAFSSSHGIAFPSVTCIVLTGRFLRADSIIAALECAPNAKEVTLNVDGYIDDEGVYTGKRGWVVSILDELAKAYGDKLCPAMTSLTLGSKERRIMGPKVTVKSLAEKVIKRRSESGAVIEVLQAHWDRKAAIQYT